MLQTEGTPPKKGRRYFAIMGSTIKSKNADKKATKENSLYGTYLKVWTLTMLRFVSVRPKNASTS